MKSSFVHALGIGVLGLAAGCASGNAHRDPPGQPVVTAEDLERSGSEPIEKVLQAKVPGVQIARTANGSISIQLRGASSFYSGTAPLYVVDESPMEPGPGGVLNGINPHDIESIRVLKDPAELGLYGMRGANGVILITTKRPGDAARTKAATP